MTQNAGLTELQKEIVAGLVRGDSLREVADMNDMTMSQLKIQLSSIWVKTGTRNPAELLKWHHSQ